MEVWTLMMGSERRPGFSFSAFMTGTVLLMIERLRWPLYVTNTTSLSWPGGRDSRATEARARQESGGASKRDELVSCSSSISLSPPKGLLTLRFLQKRMSTEQIAMCPFSWERIFPILTRAHLLPKLAPMCISSK